MQNSVLLKQTASNGYLSVYSTGGNLFIIGNFLTDDVRYTNINVFKGWLEEDRRCTGGNITSLSKTYEGTILMSDIYIEDEDYYIELTKEQYIKLLEDWKYIINQSPAGIWITRDKKGYFNFKAVDKSDEFLNGFSSSWADQSYSQ